MSNAWKYHNKLEREDRFVPSIEEIINIAKVIPDSRNRALFIFAYLTAGRISEMVRKTRRRDINFITRKMKVNSQDMDVPIVVISMPNLKNPTRQVKMISIPVHKEAKLIDYLKWYIGEHNMEEPLFNISRVRAWKILKETTRMNPHYIRHVRLTHLAEAGFSPYVLMEIAGWSNLKPATNYLMLNPRIIAEEFLK